MKRLAEACCLCEPLRADLWAIKRGANRIVVSSILLGTRNRL